MNKAAKESRNKWAKQQESQETDESNSKYA
jgi:hypothetical protein